MIERMLSDKQAARRAGLSVPTFMKLVHEGLLPPPIKYPGIKRNLWDVVLLDRSLDKHSGLLHSAHNAREEARRRFPNAQQP